MLGTGLAIVHGWFFLQQDRTRFSLSDILLAIAAVTCTAYLIFFARQLQLRAGMPMALPGDMWSAVVIVMLILELTRRLAGMALVIIASIFVAYAFLGPWLPGLFEHRSYAAKRFFSYIVTDNGILSAPIATSSTYIILFVVFAAFLQTTRVGEYFVNLAFAAAGHKRGGPEKVAIFAAGLMGMINGTSTGNVVATGALTIPMMKKSATNRRPPHRSRRQHRPAGKSCPPNIHGRRRLHNGRDRGDCLYADRLCHRRDHCGGDRANWEWLAVLLWPLPKPRRLRAASFACQRQL